MSTLDLLIWYIPPEKRTPEDQAKLDVAFSSLLESIEAAKERQKLTDNKE